MRGARLAALALGVAVSYAGPVAVAQEPCDPAGTAGSAPRAWPEPLNRPVALEAATVPLREALARVASAARIRLSYSSESLPLTRPVCVPGGGRPVGALLGELLHGTGVAPVVAGRDHLVLAPAIASSAPPATGRAEQVVELDRLVVTGTPTAGPQWTLPVALTVVGGEQMERTGTRTLAELLAASVPGMWMWEQPPSGLLARYGSIRGSSSFGTSYPKIYLDGVEVANPLVVSRIAPETVERIEVIRGPQGAALYGTEAISGVINILTRHGGSLAGGPEVRVRSGVGLSNSDFAAGPSVTQEHQVGVRAGTAARSAGLDAAVATAGAFVPGAYSRELTLGGRARGVSTRAVVTGTARLHAERSGAVLSPLLRDLLPPGDSAGTPVFPTGPTRQALEQYTAGASAIFQQSGRWTHSGVIGLDGYRLNGVTDDHRPLPFDPTAALLRASDGGADRVSARASTTGRFGTVGALATTLTLGLEQSALRAIRRTPPLPLAPDTTSPGGRRLVSWQNSTGVLAQWGASLDDRLNLTAGVRLEHNAGFASSGGWVALPLLGGTWITRGDRAALAVRAAYGRGIRPADTALREIIWSDRSARIAGTGLDPESQSGVEAGIDLTLGSSAAVQVTRYRQRATGLIQRVTIGVAEPPRGGRHEVRRAVTQLQNVGEIDNEGWELQGSATRGALSLAASLALTESRVHRLARGYTGDLRPGDRMLEVPARTVSVTGGWNDRGWSAALSLYRASDWINYDRLALVRGYMDASSSPRALTGPRLREYWRAYDGVAHLRASGSVPIRPGVSLLLLGENLLNRQVGEPDNATVLPGRTLTVGVRAAL